MVRYAILSQSQPSSLYVGSSQTIKITPLEEGVIDPVYLLYVPFVVTFGRKYFWTPEFHTESGRYNRTRHQRGGYSVVRSGVESLKTCGRLVDE